MGPSISFSNSPGHHTIQQIHQIVVTSRFAYWPALDQWARSAGGPQVYRAKVVKVTRLTEGEIERYEEACDRRRPVWFQ